MFRQPRDHRLLVVVLLFLVNTARAEDEKQLPRSDTYGDPLPPGAVARLGTVRYRLGGSYVAFSPDGKLFASGSSDHTDEKTIHLWDVSTGKETRRLVGHQGTVKAVAFSPDSKLLASASNDRTIRLWHVSTGKEVRRCTGHRGFIATVAFSPNGKMLASAGGEKSVCTWDAATGRQLQQFTGHRDTIRRVLFTPDSRTVISGSDDGTIRFWSLATGKESRLFDHQQQDCIYDLALSSDGKTLVCAGEHDVLVRDLTTGKVSFLLEQQDCSAMAVAISRDGQHVAALVGGTRVWKLATGKLIHHVRGGGSDVAFSPDGKLLAGNGWILNLATGKDLRPYYDLQRRWGRITWAPDGKTVLTGGGMETFRLWDASTGKFLLQFENPRAYVGAIGISPDCKLVACRSHGGLLIYDLNTGKIVRRLQFGMSNSDGGLYFTADGKQLVVCGSTGVVWTFDVGTGQVHHQLKLPTDLYAFSKVAFSTDRKRLAASAMTQKRKPTLALWDISAAKKPRSLWSQPTERRFPLEFSPNGKFLASHHALWEVATGQAIDRFGELDGWINPLAFSPDSKIIATGGRGRSLYLWDVASCKMMRRVEGHHAPVHSLAFSPDGKRVASGSWDGTVLVWDVAELLRDRRPPQQRWADGEMRRLWLQLGNGDGRSAWEAFASLVAATKQVVPFVAMKLQPTLEHKQVAELINDLDDRSFTVRRSASRQLQEEGLWIREALETALRGKPSPEARLRLGALLKQLAAAELRFARAIHLLEHVDTTEARRVLNRLGKEAPSEQLKVSAQAAMKRLTKRRGD